MKWLSCQGLQSSVLRRRGRPDKRKMQALMFLPRASPACVQYCSPLRTPDMEIRLLPDLHALRPAGASICTNSTSWHSQQTASSSPSYSITPVSSLILLYCCDHAVPCECSTSPPSAASNLKTTAMQLRILTSNSSMPSRRNVRTAHYDGTPWKIPTAACHCRIRYGPVPDRARQNPMANFLESQKNLPFQRIRSYIIHPLLRAFYEL